MESSELKTIIEKSGLSAYRIEKDLKIPNGTLNQVIKGTKKLPEKYEESLRGLVALDLDKVEKIATGEEQGTISDAIVPSIGIIPEIIHLDERDFNEVPESEELSCTKEGDTITFSKPFEPVPEPEEVKKYDIDKSEDFVHVDWKGAKKYKRPDMSIADLL